MRILARVVAITVDGGRTRRHRARHDFAAGTVSVGVNVAEKNADADFRIAIIAIVWAGDSVVVHIHADPPHRVRDERGE